MELKLKEVKNYEDLKTWIDEYGHNKNLPCWHHYGPADFSCYNAQSPKIMLVNSESVGYEKSKSTPVDEYVQWIQKLSSVQDLVRMKLC